MSEQTREPDFSREPPETTAGMSPSNMTETGHGEQSQGEGAMARAEEYRDVAREKAGEYGDLAREKAGEYGEKAREQATVAKDQAAGGMERMADMVRERSSGAEGGPAQAGVKVADSMENAAGYLRSHDVNEMWNDLESYARTHPTQALLGAVLTGFLVGRILR